MSEDIPAICDNCAGSNPYLKMMRQPDGEECKLCTRPFTVFRWNTDNSSHRAHKTIVCLTCARAKNCCQSCMLDLTYGISLELRDTALKMAGLANDNSGYIDDVKNKEVKAIMADKKEASFKDEGVDETSLYKNEEARTILEKLASKLSEKKPLSSKKPKDDIDLKNAEVSKLVAKLPFNGSIIPPKDENITSFFVFGIDEDLPQYCVAEVFEKHGKLKEQLINHKARCGYVSFNSRKEAECFAGSLNHKKPTPALIMIRNCPVRISWGKVRSLGTNYPEQMKIGLVVRKVMKQLAEKDRGVVKRSHSKKLEDEQVEETRKKVKIDTPVGGKISYQSTKGDFEV